jgi:hypothetical protein
MIKLFALKFFVVVGLMAGIFVLSLSTLNDPISQRLRHSTELVINRYLYQMALRADQNTLGWFDRLVVYSFTTGGAVIAYPMYPEASKALWNCVYGNGEAVELSADYFKESAFLRKKVAQLGIGDHREMGLKQAEDWRTSLVFNPYNLRITRDSVEIYYPNMHFKSNPKIITQVPFGRFTVKYRDNLVAAIQGPSYYLYARWKREE